MSITYKDAEGVAGMRQACRLASEVLDYLTPHVKPGVTTNELDKLAHDYIKPLGAEVERKVFGENACRFYGL